MRRALAQSGPGSEVPPRLSRIDWLDLAQSPSEYNTSLAAALRSIVFLHFASGRPGKSCFRRYVLHCAVMEKQVLFLIVFSLAAGACLGQSRNHRLPGQSASAPQAVAFDAEAAQRFARLALACVHKEYPNKLAHSLNSDDDVAPPRKLTPAFYGCYDWHSSVHGHWLLARLARSFPDAGFTPEARAALQQSLTPANILQEAAYLKAEGRASFERPYGLAWLLQLGVELREWEKAGGDQQVRELSANLRPLEQAAAERLKTWLPKLSHPVRSGEHSQTAFALGLAIDYARNVGRRGFPELSCWRKRGIFTRPTRIVRWLTNLQAKTFFLPAWPRRT